MNTPKILLLALVLAISATAQDDESKCCCTTYDTSVCLSRIHKKVDAELNDAYRKALKALRENYTAEDLQNLEEAERQWIAYRDAVCKAEYGLWGRGSGGPGGHMMCLIRITRQRTTDIKAAYLKER